MQQSNVFVDVNVAAMNYNFNISLILDTYNIMIVMQKIKTCAGLFSVGCLHSSLQAKPLMHNCECANVLNMLKRVFIAYKGF